MSTSKQLARFERVGHRITGRPSSRLLPEVPAYEKVHVANRRRHPHGLRRGARRRAEGDTVGFLAVPSDGFFLNRGSLSPESLSDQRPLLSLDDLGKSLSGSGSEKPIAPSHPHLADQRQGRTVHQKPILSEWGPM